MASATREYSMLIGGEAVGAERTLDLRNPATGFGQENGLPGLLEFTRPKAIYIPKTGVAQ